VKNNNDSELIFDIQPISLHFREREREREIGWLVIILRIPNRHPRFSEPLKQH